MSRKKYSVLICLCIMLVVVATFYIPVNVLIYIIAAIMGGVLLWNLMEMTNTGRFFTSVVRGIFWGGVCGSLPRKLRCEKNVRIFFPRHVSFGESCNLGQGVVLAPLDHVGNQKYPSRIKIGNRVHFGAFDRIASMNEVIIEDDVLFAAFVHVTDHSHDYRDVTKPVNKQGVFSKGPVVIKKGAWLAFGCHILSGVTVGENSVVAANAVVTKDVPPYSVVAGNPARVVSRFNFEQNKWVHVSKS